MTHLHGHSHDHHQEKCHSCGHEQCSCGSCSCGHQHDHEHGDFANDLLELADQAWMELLSEKIKKQIEANHGKQLDDLAKIVSDTNNSRWKHKMAAQKVRNEYKDKLSQYFGHE